jgi:hypothetical protein
MLLDCLFSAGLSSQGNIADGADSMFFQGFFFKFHYVPSFYHYLHLCFTLRAALYSRLLICDTDNCKERTVNVNTAQHIPVFKMCKEIKLVTGSVI